MAETVIGMILHFARGFDFAIDAQRQRYWDQTEFETATSPITEIKGATLGIVGMGGVGRATSDMAQALGMRVIGISRTHQDTTLDDLLAQSHFVLIAAPATAESRGMIGARELALMKRTAVILNVARGNLIDQDALIDALNKKQLRGAGLDVFTPEPLPETSPLWAMRNVLMLPHVSATTPHFWDREVELIEDNLRRYLAGEPLRNVVDKQRGY
jgi:phosphoglycerate dehydrogenase-like enzyme